MKEEQRLEYAAYRLAKSEETYYHGRNQYPSIRLPS
jgi:hypothetical protein